MDDMQDKADHVANFVKGFASPHRLMILCALIEGEKNVTQLIAETGIAQTSVSQHLNKLKKEGIVDYRRDHRILNYYIVHDAAHDLMQVLYAHFCANRETN